MREILALADRIASEFRPERIILFGSYAKGRPRPDSDVDLLVEMRYSGHPVRKAIQMLRRLDPRFAVDLLVNSPNEIRRRLRNDDWFLADTIQTGRVLYERIDARLD
jgi:predicted nucleotidyltransferase